MQGQRPAHRDEQADPAIAISPDDAESVDEARNRRLAVRPSTARRLRRCSATRPAPPTTPISCRARRKRPAPKRWPTLAVGARPRELFRPALQAYEASLAWCLPPPSRRPNTRTSRRARASASSSTRSMPTRPRRASAPSSPRIWSRSASTTPPSSRSTTPAPKAVEAKDGRSASRAWSTASTISVAFRPGLPAAIGEVLEAPSSCRSTCRTAPPTARFTGDSFVLPSTAAAAASRWSPSTWNVADMKLYRVGDRSLAQLCPGYQFLRQLDGYDLATSATRWASRSGRARSTSPTSSTRKSPPLPGRRGAARAQAGRLCADRQPVDDNARHLGRRAPRSGSSSPTSACPPIPARTA
jgi:hypothetical protein